MSGMSKLLIGLAAMLLISVVCACAVVGFSALNIFVHSGQKTPQAETEQQASPSNPPVSLGTEAESRTINSDAIVMVEKKAGYCKALAPGDWSFASVPPYVGADLFSPDRSIHAAWGIAGIYKDLYPTADSALTYLLGAVYTGFRLVDGPKDVGYGFWGYEFDTGVGKQGQAVYKIYDFDPGFYVISVYMAAADKEIWESKGALAFSSAISIRCVSQLRPSTSDLDYGSADPSDPSDNPEVDLSEKWSEAILGYENVYSPSTGEHYMAPLNSYWAGGPEGGGYYRELPGGGFEKLLDGLGDY